MYPGVWRHGDWIRITERGSAVIEGRSDSTLNRQGIRFGTSELYGVVERLPEILDSLVIGLELPGGRYWMPLFVVLADGRRAGRRSPRKDQRRDPGGTLAAPRPGRDRRGPGRPADADRQEDGGPGQAPAPGSTAGRGRCRRRDGRPAVARLVRRPCGQDVRAAPRATGSESRPGILPSMDADDPHRPAPRRRPRRAGVVRARAASARPPRSRSATASATRACSTAR